MVMASLRRNKSYSIGEVYRNRKWIFFSVEYLILILASEFLNNGAICTRCRVVPCGYYYFYD